MVIRNRATRPYRLVVLALAAGYWLFHFSVIPESGFGWQFRWLTIWALTASLWSAAAAWRFDLGRRDPPFMVATQAAALNAVVVFMFWRLFLSDPASVAPGGQQIPWWLQFYLHLVGPLLQWIEAIVLLGAIRRPLRSAAILGGLVLAYVVWIEVLTAPFNTFPEGSVTDGLPYPFLNDMPLDRRLVFYAGTALAAFVLLAVLAAASGLRNRIVSGRAYPSPSRSSAARPER